MTGLWPHAMGVCATVWRRSIMTLAVALKAQLADYLAHYNAQRARTARPAIPAPQLRLYTRGTSAGYCRADRNEIGIHTLLAEQAPQQTLHDTLPHELAHWIVYCRQRRGEYGRKRVLPHGREWQHVCIALTGQILACTHQLDIQHCKARRTRWRKWVGEHSGAVVWMRYRRNDQRSYCLKATGEPLRATSETVLSYTRPSDTV